MCEDRQWLLHVSTTVCVCERVCMWVSVCICVCACIAAGKKRKQFFSVTLASAVAAAVVVMLHSFFILAMTGIETKHQQFTAETCVCARVSLLKRNSSWMKHTLLTQSKNTSHQGNFWLHFRGNLWTCLKVLFVCLFVCWRNLLLRTQWRLGSTQTEPLAVFKLPVSTGNNRLLDGPVWVCKRVCMRVCVVLHDGVNAGLPGRLHAVGGTDHLGADVLGEDTHAARH